MQPVGTVMQSLNARQNQLTEVRALIFSLVAERAIAKCPLTPGGVVDFAVAQCHVSVEVAQAALKDLVALGLVELLPNGVTLSHLSQRLARQETLPEARRHFN